MRIVIAVPLFLALAACRAPDIIDADTQRANALATVREVPAETPTSAEGSATITVVDEPYVPSDTDVANWLTRIRVGDLRVTAPINGDAVLAMLRGESISLHSMLPVGNYTYAGHGVINVDGETALDVMLGGMGLDYVVDPIRQVVEVVPLPARTWTLNLGNRTSSWAASGSVTSNASSASQATSPTSSGTTSGASAGTSSATTAGSSSSTGGGANSITSQDDIWASFRDELETRLTRLAPCSTPRTSPISDAAAGLGFAAAPNVPAPMLPPNLGGAALSAQVSCLFEEQQFGRFSINPETGVVWVQAPRWVHRELDPYFKQVQAQYNTMITFEGRVILLSEQVDDTKGLDLQAAASLASGKYGFTVLSRVLTGSDAVILRLNPDSPPAVEGAVPSTTAGFRYQDGRSALQLFSGFLAEAGKVSVLQRPVISTTSGVPGQFTKSITTYYLNLMQSTSGSDGAAAVGTQNVLTPVELGTLLRVNPRWDPTTELVRAQIELDQRVQSGTLELDQYLSGDGGATVRTSIPLVSRQQVTGEVLLQDGDLIVLGGQTETEDRATSSGLPGAADGPFSWLAGRKTTNGRRSTYFFALQVTVDRKGRNAGDAG